MQLIFKRLDKNLTIEIKEGVSTTEFNYVEMIKKVLQKEVFEETLFEGDISDEEKSKINEMVGKINEALPPKEVIVKTENVIKKKQSATRSLKSKGNKKD
jgi:hypothetical protein